MSLPTNATTAKNFQLFYESIRPYLNGAFPTPIANKFSKGDLYSTDETIIGQWIDGKPLYQKVVNIPFASIGTSEWKVVYTINSGCTIRWYDFICEYNACFGEYWDGRNFELKSLLGGATIGNNSLLFLQYTKTTDSPIAIGSDTDYSTTEKIVGTWIDGKPIYQNTIELSSPVSITTSGVTISQLPSNVKQWIKGQGYKEVGDTASLYIKYDKTVFCAVGMSDCKYITVQYTKTTD